MRTPLSPRRRKAAALAGATAAFAASVNIAYHPGASSGHFYTLLGFATGVTIGLTILMLRKRSGGRACSN